MSNHKHHQPRNFDAFINQQSVKPLEEVLHGDPEVEVVDGDLHRLAAEEAFMNELVTIVVHKSNEQGADPVPMPSVGDRGQPIVRGVRTTVRRKYVEALARAQPISYSQQENSAQPDRSAMVVQRGMQYPFSVVHDPNPRGAAWLEYIMAQPT